MLTTLMSKHKLPHTLLFRLHADCMERKKMTFLPRETRQHQHPHFTDTSMLILDEPFCPNHHAGHYKDIIFVFFWFVLPFQ